MYYPEGMKARVGSVQSIEAHRILTPTRDLNQEPPGPQSRVVTTMLPLHTVRRGRLRWFGHVERKNGDDWVSACKNVVMAGVRCRVGAGRLGENV